MKKYNRFLIALLAVSALTVSACKESFLDLDPNNAITDQNFYQTQTDAIRAVNATYTPLQGLYNGAAWQILDIMSDDTDKGGGGANDGVEVYELDNFTLTSFNPMINTYYVQRLSTIFVCVCVIGSCEVPQCFSCHKFVKGMILKFMLLYGFRSS